MNKALSAIICLVIILPLAVAYIDGRLVSADARLAFFLSLGQ